MGLAKGFQPLAVASHGLAWISQGLDLAFQGLARASQHLDWASLDLAQASGGGRTDKRTDERKFSPFYRTSSPIGAAALLHIHVNYQILEQGKGTADHMMPRATGFSCVLRGTCGQNLGPIRIIPNKFCES